MMMLSCFEQASGFVLILYCNSQLEDIAHIVFASHIFLPFSHSIFSSLFAINLHNAKRWIAKYAFGGLKKIKTENKI